MDTARQVRAESLIRSIAAQPRDLQTYCALAEVYTEGGEYPKADFTLRRVIEIDPMYLRAWVDLGTLCSYREDWRSSADAFERACALDPREAANWIRYGAALLSVRDLRAATRVRDTLLTQFSDRWEGHLIAGHLHKIHGRPGAAAKDYRRALQHNPRQTDALYNLVDLSPPLASDPLTEDLEKLRSDASLADRDVANVDFSLARVYERSGQVEQAMTLYQAANTAAERAMRQLGVVYDPPRIEDEALQIVELFDAAAVATPLAPLDLDLRLIFVTGMPRSGTTLVERILSSHSAVESGGEMPFMQHCLSDLLASRQVPGLQARFDPEAEKDARVLQQLRERYLDSLFERDLDGEYVIDKLPANFSSLGLIRILFPDALIVHCSREPIATCWSLYTAHFGMHLPYNASLPHLAHYYGKVYSKLMNHWYSIMGPAIIDVSYEELVTEAEPAIRSLIRRCGLAWEESCLRFHENDAPVFTANMSRARQPASPASVDRWRAFEKYLSPLTDELGTALAPH
jgi:Tfp pilus assembly protein PilF